MDTTNREPINYFLEAGSLYLATRPALISTVLGSCVSICLWDKRKRIGGMNHYVLPVVHDNQEVTTRFGNVATPLLIKMMQEEGSVLADLEAQVFGGARTVRNISTNIGRENVNMARKILNHFGIQIVSEDVEGQLGRKIVFNSFSGEAVVLKVKQLRKTDWSHR
ncbi:MAG: chemotaxis protein CheD [bacterium]